MPQRNGPAGYLAGVRAGVPVLRASRDRRCERRLQKKVEIIMSGQSTSPGFIGVITLLFTVLTALYLLIGGAWLLSLGGSAYYIVTGVVLLGVTWLLYRRSPAALVLAGTAIWALWGSGPDFWALAPRSGVLGVSACGCCC